NVVGTCFGYFSEVIERPVLERAGLFNCSPNAGFESRAVRPGNGNASNNGKKKAADCSAAFFILLLDGLALRQPGLLHHLGVEVVGLLLYTLANGEADEANNLGAAGLQGLLYRLVGIQH